MKKLILLLFIPLVFGCSDDEDCDCGEITQKSYEVINGTEYLYIFDIEMECEGGNISVYVTQAQDNSYMAGNRICNISRFL